MKKEENVIKAKDKKIDRKEQELKILEYKKKGFSDTKISQMPDIKYCQTTVSRYVKKFKEQGLLERKKR